jgi:L-lactate dehydrogenase (cytochrome)
MAAAVQDDRSLISLDALNQHNSKTDCWIAVHSKVWDITDFINEHPGGPSGESKSPLNTTTPESAIDH